MALDISLHPSPGTLADPMSIKTHSLTIEPQQGLIGKLAFPCAFLAMAALTVGLLIGIMRINKGTFNYTLDDPYIHLALSDQIRHGNYGLFPGSHAAPSSSIIFPFLLATVAGTALHPYFPLLINLCALVFTVETMRRFLLHLKLGTDDFAMAAQAFGLFMIVLCFNMIGVVFTGLEHSLHIAAVVAIIYGLALFLDRDKMPAWLPVAIVLCPLIRYEGLALSVGALLVLALRGRILTALATLAVMVLLVGSFSEFLIKLGLPPLPSSILSKSGVASGSVDAGHGRFLAGVLNNLNLMLIHPIGLVLILIGVCAFFVCIGEFGVKPQRLSSRGLMAVVLLSMIGGHAVAGRFGWIDRYEDYLLVGTALLCIYLAQSTVRSALSPSQPGRLLLVSGFAALLLVFGARYWHMTLQVPIASNNIYEQQRQMHNFVDRFYREPVAVNDLGLVSYHNPYPVLDLGGLGSEKSRLLIAAHASPADYEAFVANNDVHLVMVYKEWFPGQIPETWQKVGTMLLSRALISAAEPDVQFYVTDDATGAKVREELASFRATLPPGVKLTIYGPDPKN